MDVCEERKLLKYGRNGMLQLFAILILLVILIELIICLLYFLPMEEVEEFDCPNDTRKRSVEEEELYKAERFNLESPKRYKESKRHRAGERGVNSFEGEQVSNVSYGPFIDQANVAETRRNEKLELQETGKTMPKAVDFEMKQLTTPTTVKIAITRALNGSLFESYIFPTAFSSITKTELAEKSEWASSSSSSEFSPASSESEQFSSKFPPMILTSLPTTTIIPAQLPTTTLPLVPIFTEFEIEKKNFSDADTACREKSPSARLMVLYNNFEETTLLRQLKDQTLEYFDACPKIFLGYRINPLEKYIVPKPYQPMLPLELIGSNARMLSPGINPWDGNCATITYTMRRDLFTVDKVPCSGGNYHCYICEFIRTPEVEQKLGAEYCSSSTCYDVRANRYRYNKANTYIRDCRRNRGRLAMIGNFTVPLILQNRIRHLDYNHRFRCRAEAILVYNAHSTANFETIREEKLAYKTTQPEYGMATENCLAISKQSNYNWVYTPCTEENCFLCRYDDHNPPPNPEPKLPPGLSQPEFIEIGEEKEQGIIPAPRASPPPPPPPPQPSAPAEDIEPPDEPPVEPPVEPPAESPAEPPAKPPAEPPAEFPAEPPAVPPVELPVEPPPELLNELPAEPPVESLVEPQIEPINIESKSINNAVYKQLYVDFIPQFDNNHFSVEKNQPVHPTWPNRYPINNRPTAEVNVQQFNLIPWQSNDAFLQQKYADDKIENVIEDHYLSGHKK